MHEQQMILVASAEDMVATGQRLGKRIYRTLGEIPARQRQ
jgi:hypothetical protein